MRNLDVTTLRSFVTVAQSGGVTRAAATLNLTQSAVSMQLKRLEELLSVQLFDRANRKVSLTPDGERLMSYAVRMVNLNDQIFDTLSSAPYEGEISIGVPHDVIYPVLPNVLKGFASVYPRIKLHLVSGPTSELKEKFKAGECDIILTTETGGTEGAHPIHQAKLVWVGSPGGNAWRQDPLPLAIEQVCAFRPVALEMLNRSELEWVMAVETQSDKTIEATVSADLAVTVMLEGHVPSFLSRVHCDGRLPSLGTQQINMYTTTGMDDPKTHLARMVEQGFKALGLRSVA